MAGNKGKQPPKTQPTRPTDGDATRAITYREPNEEKEEGQRAFLEILDLFTDFVIPGKNEEFAATLLDVLDQLELPRIPPQSDNSSETLIEEIQELRGSIEGLSKTLPGRAKSWAEVVAGDGRRDASVNFPKVVIPERRTREVIIRAPDQGVDLAQRS